MGLLVVADLGSGLLHEHAGYERADLGRGAVGRCRSGDLQRRQAAGRTAGRSDPRQEGRRRSTAPAPAVASGSAGQDVARSTRSDADVASGHAGASAGPAHARPDRGCAASSGPSVCRRCSGSGTIERTDAFAGGGSLPEERIASRAVALHPRIGAEEAAGLLRSGHPAVIGRIKDGRLLLDMLTVSDTNCRNSRRRCGRCSRDQLSCSA